MIQRKEGEREKKKKKKKSCEGEGSGREYRRRETNHAVEFCDKKVW